MITMILGPSGTGKSVCIKHMVGLLYPDEGDVLVHGHSVPDMTDDELFDMRKKFGVLFQDGALFGSMNLYDNVAFPLRQHTEKSRGRDPRDRLAPPARGRPGRRRGEDAERALGRHAQARRLRARAGARPRDRALRRAGLRPRPGSHGAPVRPHQGGPRGERRHLRRDHARHRLRAPARPSTWRSCGAARSSRRGCGRSCSSPRTSSCASSWPATRAGPWAWNKYHSHP